MKPAKIIESINLSQIEDGLTKNAISHLVEMAEAKNKLKNKKISLLESKGDPKKTKKTKQNTLSKPRKKPKILKPRRPLEELIDNIDFLDVKGEENKKAVKDLINFLEIKREKKIKVLDPKEGKDNGTNTEGAQLPKPKKKTKILKPKEPGSKENK